MTGVQTCALPISLGDTALGGFLRQAKGRGSRLEQTETGNLLNNGFQVQSAFIRSGNTVTPQVILDRSQLSMEFEPGCELQPADELRQAKAHTAGRWKEASPDLYYLASFGWFRGWPLAKSAAMEAEREVQQFAVSWAEAWARAEVRAWAQVKATLVVEVGTSVTQIGDHSGGHSHMTFYPLRGVPSRRLPTRVMTPRHLAVDFQHNGILAGPAQP